MTQAGLSFTDAPTAAPTRTLHYLGGLDPHRPAFARLAAQRVAALNSSRAIEAALAEVPRESLQFVETLTVTGLATRIAQEVDAGARERLFQIVPESLMARVQPLAKSYACARRVRQ